ncbi:hemolysin XhlA family protein [Fictibacillus nanhaiensis]|uniref:hemolysin XhlA family protein n=1 Tax=Fictibacillus nanhaiensis TaxID=742169 RepID=UPI003C21D1F8
MEETTVNPMNPLEKDIIDIKGDIKNIMKDVEDLKRNDIIQDQKILNINEKLAEISENTKWIKRTITGAIIATLSTGLIGGSIAVIFNVFSK